MAFTDTKSASGEVFGNAAHENQDEATAKDIEIKPSLHANLYRTSYPLLSQHLPLNSQSVLENRVEKAEGSGDRPRGRSEETKGRSDQSEGRSHQTEGRSGP